MIPTVTINAGDNLTFLRKMPNESVQCCVTSPPYWGLRDYGVEGQIGLEPTLGEFLERLVDVFREVRRVLREDGVCWVNMGDGYARQGGETDTTATTRTRELSHMASSQKRLTSPPEGLKPKDLIGQPWRLAFALQSDGWWLRQDIIWHKPNPMPESVRDRCTKAHEYVFMLTKAERYFWDAEAMKEAAVSDHASGNGFAGRQGGASHMPMTGGRGTEEEWLPGGKRNRRSVWTIATEPYSEAHFATFPTELPRRCILASSRPGDTVLDPFGGSGTTGMVALELGRNAVLCELNPQYAELARKRCNVTPGLSLM